jgi:hypothetical protein
MSRHIIIKFWKIHTKKTSKQSERNNRTTGGKTLRVTADFSSETIKSSGTTFLKS